jgi:mannose-6-phosphate isomerase-like protein (cupin superfamily)
MDLPPSTTLSDAPRTVAPDGSEVRVLRATDRGSMAQFELVPGRASLAVRHRTVEEIWLVLEGRGEMWRRRGASEAVTPLEPGVCLTIPVGTAFRFRCLGPTALRVVAVTIPPWPGDAEAEPVPDGPDWAS